MKIIIDLKSALLGLVVGVAVMFSVGAGTTPSPNPVGKYQCRLVSTSHPDLGYALILDTQTGKSWGATLSRNWHDLGSFWDEK